jgi:hypothetical protein
MIVRCSRMLAVPTLMIATLGIPNDAAQAQSDLIRQDVEYLSHDDRGGRVTGTDGWWAAHVYIHDRLLAANIPHDKLIAQGVGWSHPDMLDPSEPGYSLFARIDGSDPALRDQYVLIGAHYDHVALGDRCEAKLKGGDDGQDSICNGATDNATGVGVVLEIARRLAQGPAPARSVVFAFWDREEYDFGGSVTFRTSALPSPWPQQLATYINFDIQGANLLDGLASSTFAIDPSPGGSNLRNAVDAAAASAPSLTVRHLSQTLGMYSSDYATFVAPATVNSRLERLDPTLPRIPTVFFTDSRGPCYHTTQDEVDVVNWAKLADQATIGTSLARDLANRSTSSLPTIEQYDDRVNREFDTNLRNVADVLAPVIPDIQGLIPGPVPPPTAADAQQLLEVAQAAYIDPAIDASAKPFVAEQIRNLSLSLSGGPGEYSALTFKWTRTAGAYVPEKDGVFVALAAVLAQTVIQNVACTSL